jgi:hypothetical protein
VVRLENVEGHRTRNRRGTIGLFNPDRAGNGMKNIMEKKE